MSDVAFVMMKIALTFFTTLVLLSAHAPLFGQPCPPEYDGTHLELVCNEIAKQTPLSGTLVLDEGEMSLYTRAWLTNNAVREVNVQYFIWSSDNIGILAAEVLLSAAERGVKVRVIVDDLLLDVASTSLLALARHPNIEIRIYNPVHKIGVSKVERIFHLVTDFRNSNQRMHDKTLIVDDAFAVTGGRNMADEYYDYDQEYNFRDRDVLLMGPVVSDMKQNFERFWNHPLAKPVESILSFERMFVGENSVEQAYKDLHDYANKPENFSPHIQQVINVLPESFPGLLERIAWSETTFISDLPGKNDGKAGLKGGGLSTAAIVELLENAEERIVIQSPYLIFPDGSLEFFKRLIDKGVEIKISTNSLASTDNLMAFSGYKKQRKDILSNGIKVYEFKPYPDIQKKLIKRFPELEHNAPVFAIHAKTLVVDGKITFIGTFNFDPRSANLNTEVGVIIKNTALSKSVEESILKDMSHENSWNAQSDDPDKHAPLGKKIRLGIWKILPLKSLL